MFVIKRRLQRKTQENVFRKKLKLRRNPESIPTACELIFLKNQPKLNWSLHKQSLRAALSTFCRRKNDLRF